MITIIIKKNINKIFYSENFLHLVKVMRIKIKNIEYRTSNKIGLQPIFNC